MPLERKHGSGDYASFLNDISSWVDDDFSELVFENGQLMVKSQAISASRAPLTTNSHFSPSGAHVDTVKGRTSFSEAEKFVNIESFLHDKSPLLLSGELDLCLKDEMVPWLGYPLGDYTERVCSSEVFSEVSRDVGNQFSTDNSSDPVVESGNGGEEGLADLHCCNDALKTYNFPSKANVLWPPQDTLIPGGAASDLLNIRSIQTDDKRESQIKGLPMTASKLVSFPHISRHTTNFQKPKEVLTSVLSAEGEMQSQGKGLSVNDSIEKRMSPALYGSMSKGNEPHVPFVPGTLSYSEQPVIDLLDQERNDFLQNDAAINHKNFPSSIDFVKQIPGDGRSLETHIACSSRGIVPRADIISCNKKNTCNMKFDDSEDSDGHSSVSILECAGTKLSSPPQNSSGSKRRRTAEVHNHSERRRRNRINEKLKELQELIPNSIKTDKASVLDQATEYLKMLKLQVQAISMGKGLCMSSMLPPGMQAMYPYHFTHILQMGIGSGMDAQFRVGMPPNDRFLISPATPMHQPHPSMLPPVVHPNLQHPEYQTSEVRVNSLHDHHQWRPIP